MEISLKMKKEIKHPKKNTKNAADLFWFFLIVVLPLLSIMYAIGESIYKFI